MKLLLIFKELLKSILRIIIIIPIFWILYLKVIKYDKETVGNYLIILIEKHINLIGAIILLVIVYIILL